MSRTIWHNAHIITMNAGLPRAEALVTEGGRILFVGRSKDALDYTTGESSAIDLEGRTIVPGFNDNHVHSVILGDHQDVPRLAGLNAEEIVAALRGHYADAPAGALIIGYAWDYPACPQPHRSVLDSAFPDNPVVLPQYGGHGQWLNTRALQAIGVTRDTPDPPRVVIVRDESGEPTGIVREMTSNPLVIGHFFGMHASRPMRERRLDIALDTFRRLGLTSIQDNTWYAPTAFSLARLRDERKLTARYSCWSHGSMPDTIPLMSLPSYDRVWVRRGPWKYFLDGSFTTHTAWLWEPYQGEPDNTGGGMHREEIAAVLSRLARSGTQGAFHAIGDRAISEFLDAVEDVAQLHPEVTRLRLRIEHGQLIRAEDIPRLARLGVLVSAQPSALGTPEKDIALLGEKRATRAYPYRSLLDAGVPLSFGSDIPGEATCDPILALHRVVNRPGPERITVEEALYAYTMGSAYAEFQEGVKGSLEAGKLADFVVLSEDPTGVAMEKIGETRVLRTIVDGRTVFDSSAPERAAARSV